MAAFVTGPVPERFTRDVTATPAEFERDLRKAWPPGIDTVATGHFRVRTDACVLDIRIEPAGVRRLGLFCLPVLSACYEFTMGGEGDRREILTRLDRAMQRGGG